MFRFTERRSVPVAVAVCVALSASACGIGDKSRHAERIQASVAALARTDVDAEFTYALVTEDEPFAALTDTTTPVVDERLARLLRDASTLTVHAELEPSRRRALVTVGDDAEVGAIFRDNEIFVRRLNARATERRVWARYDIEQIGWKRTIGLEDLAPPALSRATALAINPVFFVELVTGALAGSVKSLEREPIGDTVARHYTFNLSFDKAMNALDFDDAEQVTRYALFRQFGITKDVVPGEAWVDDEGRVRKIAVTVPVTVDPLRSHELTITAVLNPATSNVHVAPPAAESTVTYEALARLVRAGLPAESAA